MSPVSLHWQADSLPLNHLGGPYEALLLKGFPGGTVVKNPSANVGDAIDTGSFPGLGRCPGVGTGNPLQYSCLGNPMGRGTW